MPTAKKFYVFLAACLFFGVVFSLVQRYGFFSPGKSVSAWQRIEMWKGALRMFFDNPLGVGAGLFDFSFLPYKEMTAFKPDENVIEKTPHNEFLRYLTEDGVFFSLSVLLLFSMEIFRRYPYLTPSSRLVIIPFFIFFLIQAVFQFPFLNPIPFFIFSVICAYFLSETEKDVAFQDMILFRNSLFLKKIVCFFLLSCVSVGGWLRCYGNFLLAQKSHDPVYLRQACLMDFGNWVPCVFAVRASLFHGNPAEGLRLADDELSKNPNNFFILASLGDFYMSLGEWEKSCFYWKKYQRIFKSSLNPKDVLPSYCLEGDRQHIAY